MRDWLKAIKDCKAVIKKKNQESKKKIKDEEIQSIMFSYYLDLENFQAASTCLNLHITGDLHKKHDRELQEAQAKPKK